MAWLSGWNYRKSITLSRAAGAVSNYPMVLLVGESSGATGENVDCGGFCQSDFDDLRFTTSDGTTLLDYWIEVISGTTPNQLATVWIEFNSIGTSATTFYMYYGNVGATTVSNGINTFGVGNWDNFEWGSDGDSIATSGGNISWTVITGVAQIDTAYAFAGTRSFGLINNAAQNDVEFTVAASEEKALRCRFYKVDAVGTTNMLMHGNGTKIVQVYCDSSEKLFYYDTSSHEVGSFTSGAWHVLEANNFDWTSFTYDIALDGVTVKSGASMRTYSGYDDAWRLQQNASMGTGYNIDNVIIRQFASPEPAWGAWGSQEGDYIPRHGFTFFQDPGIF